MVSDITNPKKGRRTFLKLMAGGAGAAGMGALLAHRYDALATVPNTGNPAVVSQWGETQPYTLVFVDQNGAAYVRDGADGSMLVSAGIVTSVGAARGIGTAGAGTKTAGIQEALATGKTVNVSAGTYNLPVTFAGITLASYQEIRFDDLAIVKVPNAYTGVLFIVPSACSYARITGGFFNEQGTPANNWDALNLGDTLGTGIYFNAFRDMIITNPNRGVVLNAPTGGSLIGNLLEGMTIQSPNVGFDFTTNLGTFDANTFVHCEVEASSLARCLGGFRNIYGAENSFLGCAVYDIQGSNFSATVKIGSGINYIIGGQMTKTNFADASNQTVILDNTSSIHNIPTGSHLWRLNGQNQMILDATGLYLQAGYIKRVNGINTAGQVGVSPVWTAYNSTPTNGALTAVGSYIPPALAGTYRVMVNVYCTVGTTCSFSVKVNYKDLNGTAHSDVISLLAAAAPGVWLAGGLVVAAGTYYSLPFLISINNSATPITFSTVGTFTTVTYSLNASGEQVF
jgi:hypothetical protein